MFRTWRRPRTEKLAEERDLNDDFIRVALDLPERLRDHIETMFVVWSSVMIGVGVIAGLLSNGLADLVSGPQPQFYSPGLDRFWSADAFLVYLSLVACAAGGAFLAVKLQKVLIRRIDAVKRQRDIPEGWKRL